MLNQKLEADSVSFASTIFSYPADLREGGNRGRQIRESDLTTHRSRKFERAVSQE
jgi:hypothetical protein